MSTAKICLLAGFFIAALGLLYLYNPAETHLFPLCPFHALTGLYCPGCGSTRAVHQLLHGCLTGALAMNPLMVVSLPLIALLYFRKKWLFRPWVAWSALIILVSYGVLRNIPVWPFVFLAPK